MRREKSVGRILLFLFVNIYLLYGGVEKSKVEEEDSLPLIRPLTRYGIEMSKYSDIMALKGMWDSLKTEYDRRYFLFELPGFCEARGVIDIPEWIRDIIKESLNSEYPLLVYEAVNAIGNLKVEYGDKLIKLYSAVPYKFGCHEEMLKCAIINAISKLEYKEKEDFYDSILRRDLYCLSPTFQALIYSIAKVPSVRYVKKLENYQKEVEEEIKKKKESKSEIDKYFIPKYMEVYNRIGISLDKCKNK